MKSIPATQAPQASQAPGAHAAPPAAAPAAMVWVLTDGSVGMENQGLAVAEALGLPFACKRVRRRGALRHLPTWAQTHWPARALLGAISPKSDRLAPPWPRVLISIGRHSVPLALAIKRLSGTRTFALHIQNPKVSPARFDLVAVPLHDKLEGPNIVTTFGAAHRVTPARLAKAAEALAPQLVHLPRPRIVVLIGGASKAFRFGPGDAKRMGEDLARLARKANTSLLVTPSRRTGAENAAIITSCFEEAGIPALVWDGQGDNPYYAYLGVADVVIVTGDSVNMVTEATGTGKPVYVYPLRGHSARIANFHTAMRQRGATRTFDGRLEFWSYVPVNDTEVITAAVRRALGTEMGA